MIIFDHFAPKVPLKSPVRFSTTPLASLAGLNYLGKITKTSTKNPEIKTSIKKITENAELQKVANYLATSILRVKP